MENVPHPIAVHLSILVMFIIHATSLTTRPSYNPLSHIPQYPYYTFTNTSLRPLPLPSRPQSYLPDCLHPVYLSDSLTSTFTYIHQYIFTYYFGVSYLTTLFSKKGKAIPVTDRAGPWICETSRLPHFLDNLLTDGGEVVSPTLQAVPVTGRGGP
jgi:hypothetical protein